MSGAGGSRVEGGGGGALPPEQGGALPPEQGGGVLSAGEGATGAVASPDQGGGGGLPAEQSGSGGGLPREQGGSGAVAPTQERAGVVLPPGVEAERWVRMERRFSASTERVLRCLTDPEEIVRWFPERIEGSLAAGTRSTLIWSHTRVWWDVLTVEPGRSLVFRWPWGREEKLVTTVKIRLERDGYGSRLFLEDGPFPIDEPGGLEAWAEAIEGWADALARLRAFVDFSIDLRMRG